MRTESKVLNMMLEALVWNAEIEKGLVLQAGGRPEQSARCQMAELKVKRQEMLIHMTACNGVWR